MMVRERTRSLIRLHRHKRDEQKNENDLAAFAATEERNKREIQDLRDQLEQQRDAYVKRDQLRIQQINALIAQLDMLGVEPAVRLEDTNASSISPSTSMGCIRRSLDYSHRKKYHSMNGINLRNQTIVDDVVDDDDVDEEGATATRSKISSLCKERKSNMSSSLSSSPEDETPSIPEVIVLHSPRITASPRISASPRIMVSPRQSASPRHLQQSSGSSSSCGSDNGSTTLGASNLSVCTRADSLGNEALQLRLHELETLMEEQDSLHQEEIDKLSQQLEDAKTLIAQYQSLLSESEVALQRVETVAGLRSAIASKHNHIALSEGELRVVSQNDQVRTAMSTLLDALITSKAQNSGPTMHKVYDILHELTDDSIMAH